ncbi:hypothetical protein ACIHCQ_38730 [Streptomyces sp. NPDC052236]|uniref:hypothetical protein n=1 Tax=Streptomyces sp. NPDC052236 TaxID=3365686 RepID=UPI0037D5C5B1
MYEPDDHLTGLLKQAAVAAQDRTVPAPAAEILARGARHRRRRFAAITAAACLAVGALTGVATITLTPSDHGGRVEPAGDPAPNPSPAPSESVMVEPGPVESTGGESPSPGAPTASRPPGPGASDTGQSTGPDSSTTFPPGPGAPTVGQSPGPGASDTGQSTGPDSSTTFPPGPSGSATMTSNRSG